MTVLAHRPSEQLAVDYGAEETGRLFARLRTGSDPRAREELVRRYMPLARKLASRYMNPYEPFDDLLQVASLGLIGAIDRFDAERGVGFPSFAIPTILGELKRYFRSTGWSAHVPRGAQELAMRVDRGSRQHSGPHGTHAERELNSRTISACRRRMC